MNIDLTPNEREFLLNMLKRNIVITNDNIKQAMENYKGNKAELDTTLLFIKQEYVHIDNLESLILKLNMK